MNYYKSGVSSVGQYQMSGRPYITGSNLTGSGTNNGEVKIRFPYLPKSFNVINKTTSSLFVHFDTRTNTNVVTYGHYITLPSENDSYTFDVRTPSVYISMSASVGLGRFELFGELTGIDANEHRELSGSGINNKPSDYRSDNFDGIPYTEPYNS